MAIGFIYKWFDLRNNLEYIGKHRGSTNDGYVSSSEIMLKEYKNRPDDFKREILWYSENTGDSELCKIESSILSNIPDDQFYFGCNRKYYNQVKTTTDPYTASINKYGEDGLFLLKSKTMIGNIRGSGNRDKTKTEEHKQKISESVQKRYKDKKEKDIILSNANTGRKRATPYEEVICLVKEKGFTDAAGYLSISIAALKGRYYNAVKALRK
jgi:hypothetical protein